METRRSKIALIRDAWPDILAAVKAGHTLKQVCETLNKAGIAVEYKALRAYASVVRREQARRSAPPVEPRPRSTRVSDPAPAPTPSVSGTSRANPLATAMEYLTKVRGFQNFTGEPPDPDKIF